MPLSELFSLNWRFQSKALDNELGIVAVNLDLF